MNKPNTDKYSFRYELTVMKFLDNLWNTNKLHKIFFISVQVLSCISCIVLISIDMFVNSADLKIIIEKVFVAAVLIFSLLKGYLFLRQNRRFYELFNTFNGEADFKPKTLEEGKIVEKGFKLYKIIVQTFLSAQFICLLVGLLMPVERNQYLTYSYPFDVSRSPLFELAFIHQYISILSILFWYLFPECLMMASTFFVGIQYDLMCHCLVYEKNVKSLKNMVSRHCKVLR